MASPRRLAFMLLVSWIFLLYWTASSAESHDHRPSTRIRRALPSRTRENTKEFLTIVKDSLTVVKDALATAEKNNLITLMKSVSNVANMAPGIGGLAASLINMALAFTSQESPLTELRKGIDEVSRKLDSLSMQISNLATDVEWFNYASVYSQDEVRILNAWNKLSEFRQSSESVQSEEARLQMAEVFARHYESSGAEASVSNLYHYLTVSSTALSGNLNDLLRKKFKCGIREITRYNVYFSILLWKGMVVSQVYWNLMGFYLSGKEEQHMQMFKKVHEVQSSTVDFCLTNYKEYMKKDVEEITKKLNPNKDAIAEQVKKDLDEKYDWYSWVVLVYDSNKNDSYSFFGATLIEVDDIMVAVSHTLKGERVYPLVLKLEAMDFLRGKSCESVGETDLSKNENIYPQLGHITLSLGDYVKVTHASYDGGQSFAERPTPFQPVDCSWGTFGSGKASVHRSRRMEVCTDTTCQNNGKCKQLLDSNDWLCDCQDGYHGDTCEEKVDTSVIQDMKTLFPTPVITTTSTKLRTIESKLDTMMSNCQCS